MSEAYTYLFTSAKKTFQKLQFTDYSTKHDQNNVNFRFDSMV